jgi:hypothetical protein
MRERPENRVIFSSREFFVTPVSRISGMIVEMRILLSSSSKPPAAMQEGTVPVPHSGVTAGTAVRPETEPQPGEGAVVAPRDTPGENAATSKHKRPGRQNFGHTDSIVI